MPAADVTTWVVEITINKSAGRTNGHTGGESPLGPSARAELAFGGNVLFSTNIPLRTEGALIRGHHGSKPAVIRCVGSRHGAEWTSDDTFPTPGAEVHVQNHYAVMIQLERTDVTLREAFRLITVHAEQRHSEPFEGLFGFLGNDIERNVIGPEVLIFASRAARIATVAFFEIDDESEPRHGDF